MNEKQVILGCVLIFVDTLIGWLIITNSELVPILVGALITSNVALIIAIVTQDTGDELDKQNNPKMVLGIPPEEWPVRAGVNRVMGERIGYARLTVPVEMMTIGPRSTLRLDRNYHYYEREFANYAGLYRVPK